MDNTGPCFLLAEDSDDDTLILRKALRESFTNHTLSVVRDGEQAIAYFEGSGQFADRSRFPLPDLFLLDLFMPRKDGFEVLQWLRNQSQFKCLPIVVLTSSQNLRDMNLAYRFGATSFLLKPPNYKDLLEITRFLPIRFLLPITPPQIPPASSAPEAK
jgi:CheY-like chemotaxis protein